MENTKERELERKREQELKCEFKNLNSWWRGYSSLHECNFQKKAVTLQKKKNNNNLWKAQSLYFKWVIQKTLHFIYQLL